MANEPGKYESIYDLRRFLNLCDDLAKRGHSESGIAYAMGFNEVSSFRAFKAIVVKNVRELEASEE